LAGFKQLLGLDDGLCVYFLASDSLLNVWQGGIR